SVALSRWFYDLLDKTNQRIVFFLGGAQGHTDDTRQKAKEILSLSPLTFPHELCRILFLEQLYRIQCIREKHPYHQI
ncbi:MAG: 23S rRNA (pseudouridine(1915)-N(3))-methyltransferase RlmH, partial [Pseudomonadota bacterium]